jgi:hypothetical protein
MAREGRYYRLQAMQDLQSSTASTILHDHTSIGIDAAGSKEDVKGDDKHVNGEIQLASDTVTKTNASRARMLALKDAPYLLLGAVGALLAGVMFPGKWLLVAGRNDERMLAI